MFVMSRRRLGAFIDATTAGMVPVACRDKLLVDVDE
jgi:hypothetical protein